MTEHQPLNRKRGSQFIGPKDLPPILVDVDASSSETQLKRILQRLWSSIRSNLVGKMVICLASVALIAADPRSKWEHPADCGAARKNLPPYSELAKALRYDTKAPVVVDVLSKSDDGTVEDQNIEFDTGGGVKCSGYLIAPDHSGRYPGVVWLGSGDKEWERYAIEFSKLGAVSIVLDYCGEASVVDARPFFQQQVQMVINVRRAVNILSARKDVDRRRIAFVGHSGGAILGADAVAVDKRFKAAVFESGLQGFTYHICTSPYPFAVGVRKELTDRILSYVSVLAPLDAILYVGHAAPTALLFQSARLDEAVPQSDAKAFFDAASEPKQLKWYDTGHKMLLPAVTKDRTEFLKKELGMN
jgi:cephalosporin-C deacetylase-like acetyl esterase